MSDNIPEDERHAPEWMNKEFFENVLKNTDDSVEVSFQNKEAI